MLHILILSNINVKRSVVDVEQDITIEQNITSFVLQHDANQRLTVSRSGRTGINSLTFRVYALSDNNTSLISGLVPTSDNFTFIETLRNPRLERSITRVVSIV